MINSFNTIVTLLAVVTTAIRISAITICYGQTAPAIQWQNTIGGTNADAVYSINQTDDGGYILGGVSKSNISGDKTENNWDPTSGTNDIWILKTDPFGSILWQNTIGGSSFDDLKSISQTTDGGYILGGLSASNISGDKTEDNCDTTLFTLTADFWIIKTDSLGNIQWQNTIGGSGNDFLFSIQQTTDGGFFCGGYSLSGISCEKTENSNGLYDFWIIKTDAMGNIQWQNTIGGSNDDNLVSNQLTSDGGYILGGYSTSNVSGDKSENSNGGSDYWIVKSDSSGNIQWQNTIGGSSDDYLYSIQQTSDGGYILGGYSSSNISGDKTENSIGAFDYWIVKTDSLGNIQWQNTIGGNSDELLFSIQQTNDGGFIIGGFSDSNISGDKTENSIGDFDYWIAKTDSFGNLLWENTIGGTATDELWSAITTTDGGYIMGGESLSNISGDKTENSWNSYDFWIVKIAPDTITGTSPPPSQSNEVLLVPNPFTDELSVVNFSIQHETEMNIFDIFGRIIAQKSISASDNIFKTSDFAPGIYFVEVLTGNQKVISKVVKQ